MRDTGPRTTTTTMGLASIGPGGDVLLASSRQAAHLLSVSERTLWGITSPRGSVPCVRIGSRCLYSPDALRTWIAAQTAST